MGIQLNRQELGPKGHAEPIRRCPGRDVAFTCGLRLEVHQPDLRHRIVSILLRNEGIAVELGLVEREDFRLILVQPGALVVGDHKRAVRPQEDVVGRTRQAEARLRIIPKELGVMRDRHGPQEFPEGREERRSLLVLIEMSPDDLLRETVDHHGDTGEFLVRKVSAPEPEPEAPRAKCRKPQFSERLRGNLYYSIHTMYTNFSVRQEWLPDIPLN